MSPGGMVEAGGALKRSLDDAGGGDMQIKRERLEHEPELEHS